MWIRNNGQVIKAHIKNDTRRPSRGDVVTFRYTWMKQQNEVIRRAQITGVRGEAWSSINVGGDNQKKFIPCM